MMLLKTFFPGPNLVRLRRDSKLRFEDELTVDPNSADFYVPDWVRA